MLAGAQERGTNEGMGTELEALKSDMSRVKADLESLVEAVVGRARSETETLAGSAKRRAESGVNSVETYIEQRPFTTVLVALGVGLFIGKVFSR